MPYWDNDPTEDLLMEVTKGAIARENLLAPRAKSGSGAAFNLALSAHAGDTVIHYDSNQRAIVAVSRVVDSPQIAPFDWISPSAGPRAGRHEGVMVPLGPKVEIDPPISLDEIRRRQDSIFAIKRDLEARTRHGEPLNFPWIEYNGTLRTALPYLAKFPESGARALPTLQDAVGKLT